MFKNLKFIFSAILVVACSHCIAADEANCPQICPAIYSPICATDGKIYKEFGNSCELEASNCRQERAALKPYTKTDMAWCSSTFVENLLQKLGNPDLTKPECLKPCAMIYAPVCVSNGELRATLSNKCEMEIFNCALGFKDVAKQFRILKEDAC